MQKKTQQRNINIIVKHKILKTFPSPDTEMHLDKNYNNKIVQIKLHFSTTATK